MTGRKQREPDPADPGRKQYRDAENIDERDGRDPIVETEETVRDTTEAAPDSRDVKTGIDKERLRRR